MTKLLTAAEAARRLGLSEDEVAELAAQGALQALWIGGEVLRFHPDDVAAWHPRQSFPVPGTSLYPVPAGTRRPSARSPVATVQGPAAEPSAPTSLGRSGLTTVSSQPVPAPATWWDRVLELVYAYDGYVVTAVLVLTILVAFFVAPK